MLFVPIDPIHPGEILRAEFMADYELNAEKLARDVGLTQGRLSAVLNAEAMIDADMALRLSRYFSNSPEYWLNLQRTYDLAMAFKQAKDLDEIRPIEAA
jgi:addiction module HigA family antidote